ncbi:LysR family transcriptional regulator [Pseudoduganella namucuonensis]|uniref:Transcriptional regulator, LysR family n=1 Tax=Pseudoduganella namucuonensis TaxID=1035707 RepID=A0A1I7KYC9_9BURK|nr:LysR family transcriptional regulator [Pseudoduganella namucuonensis]SFV02522.1 transcriptional regulator, LysR family [Pseudoduganella namucuonensis]
MALNPQRLAIFAAIIQAGSISAAALQLRCGKSVVSRQLAKLEEELGARLIQRSTRRLALTEIGELVLQEARRIERALANIEQLSGQYQQQARGLLRVSCSMAGRRVLVPLLAEFTTRHPQVKVALQLDDRMVDLIAEQIDVAIRTSNLVDSTLIARKLSDNPSVIVAAPSYLTRAGTPQTVDDLRHHACLLYAVGSRVYDEWAFQGPGGPYTVRVDGPLQMNDGGALVTAAAGGAGILKVPLPLVREELASGELVKVLAHLPLPPGPSNYAVYPARDFLALKTAAFVDFLQERLSHS